MLEPRSPASSSSTTPPRPSPRLPSSGRKTCLVCCSGLRLNLVVVPNAAIHAADAGVLLATAAVTMAAVKKIYPSQLAEEQHNATRLWRELERNVRAQLAANTPTTKPGIKEAMVHGPGARARHRLPAVAVPWHAQEVSQGRRAHALEAEQSGSATQEVQELRPSWQRCGCFLQRIGPKSRGRDARPPPGHQGQGRERVPHGGQA